MTDQTESEDLGRMLAGEVDWAELAAARVRCSLCGGRGRLASIAGEDVVRVGHVSTCPRRPPSTEEAS